jgi:signal peptidase I
MMKTACLSNVWSRYRSLLSASIALICSAQLFRDHFRLSIVVGTSMLPTLSPGEVLLVDKRAYQKKVPQRGDIVVARDASGWIVKRVVGLPGEAAEVRKGKLYINGAPFGESYPVEPGLLEVGKGKLLSDDYATLGDNRAIPSALAIHPILTKSDILGKVVLPWRKPVR